MESGELSALNVALPPLRPFLGDGREVATIQIFL